MSDGFKIGAAVGLAFLASCAFDAMANSIDNKEKRRRESIKNSAPEEHKWAPVKVWDETTKSWLQQ